MPMTRRRLKETRRNGRICLFNNFPVFLIILLLMFLYLRNMCWRASLTSVAMMKSVGRYQHTDWIPWERGLEIVATAVWKTEEGWCEIMQNNNNKKKKGKKERKVCRTLICSLLYEWCHRKNWFRGLWECCASHPLCLLCYLKIIFFPKSSSYLLFLPESNLRAWPLLS